ncbi:MAG: ketoacyl-ACP synthase III [Chloroflexi bacterium]|nr:ketoacyl-ACP synthase III [Chloroflexota bacterium]
MHPRVTGWGKYIPDRVLTNHQLEQTLDTSDEWIVTRTGIRERRIASDVETASSMAAQAARQALRVARVEPGDVDMIILATSSPNSIMPACASLVQRDLNSPRAACFDVNAACSGFMYALAAAFSFVQTGAYRNVLVTGSEVYSRVLDWGDRGTCVLFGDGAGAVLVQGAERRATGKVGIVLGSDGSQSDLLQLPGIADTPARQLLNGHYHVRMDGKKVFKLAVTIMGQAASEAISKAGLTPEQVDLFIPHQANIRIIDAIVRSMGLPQERVFVNVDKFGNTAAASIPIAISEAVEQGRLTPGQHVVMVAFGGGMSWGAMAFQW